MAYKRAKDIKVGSLVEIPLNRWSNTRSGWNGWNFTVGTVEKLYISTTGKKCAVVKYCSRRGGRYELLPVTYAEKRVLIENCFDATLTLNCCRRNFPECEEAEKRGEQVCWSNEDAFLVDNGYIDYWKKSNKEVTS